MKMRYIILGLVVISTTVFASLVIPYDKSKPPALPLPDAYRLAATTLGSLTNRFHCISAVIPDFGQEAWLFTFCSTNTPPRSKFVTVYFSGKVDVADIIAR
jgi:hypothetical protein